LNGLSRPDAGGVSLRCAGGAEKAWRSISDCNACRRPAHCLLPGDDFGMSRFEGSTES